MAAKRYELGRCTLEADGYTLSGFGASGGVKVTMPETATVEHGADGESAVSIQKPKYAGIEITLISTSVANKYLDAIHTAQANEDTLADRAFTLFDPGNGDRLTAKQFVILQRPEMSKMKSAGERTWKCEVYDFTWEFAAGISG